MREHSLTDSLRLLCLFGQMLKETNARSSTGIVKTGDKGHLLFEGMALYKSNIALNRSILFQPFKQAAKMENCPMTSEFDTVHNFSLKNEPK